jgi:hypothetical protein
VNIAANIAVEEDIRRWIAEILLLGVPADAIAAELQRQGFARETAEAEVKRALDSPYFQGAAVLRQRLAKREWILSCIGRLAKIEGLDAIDTVHALPAEEFFRDYYCAHRPVIVTGLVDDWPALKLWSPDYFAEALGDPVVEVQVGRESTPSYESESFRLKQEMPLGRLLAMLREDRGTNDFYITAKNGQHNRQALSRLWDDVGTIDGYLDPQSEADGYFWMGPRGTVTPFHHDLTNNLLVAIKGRKQVTLVPSWETPRMLNHQHCFSGWSGPEALASLPEADRPTMLGCMLEPGQTLFIPVGWWHHVVGLDMTIAMSFINFTRENDFDRGYDCYGRV